MLSSRRSWGHSRPFLILTIALLLWLLAIIHNPLRWSPPGAGTVFGGMRSTIKGIAKSSHREEPYAYVFYATANTYACSVLVNAQRLRSLGSSYPIHVLVSSDVTPAYLSAFAANGIQVHLETVPDLPAGNNYYRKCLLKLLAFNMHTLQPGLRRIIVLDSDQLIMKNMDHLLSGLPMADLAAPRAYWISKERFSSAFLVIGLSDRLWGTVQRALETLEPEVYDMDVLNEEFGGTVMMLGGEFVTINSHWEAWTLPDWFHADLGGGPGASLTSSTNSTNATTAHVQHHLSSGADKSRRELERQLWVLQTAAAVIHFTALGKPWSFRPEDVIEERPEAHPLFGQQFAMWREIAADVCPGGLRVLDGDVAALSYERTRLDAGARHPLIED